MKFTQAPRQLHRPTYNPPCNLYQHPPSPAAVLTGTLAGPALPSPSTFGLAPRMEAFKHNAPGPGSYLTDQNNPPAKKTTAQLAKIKPFALHPHDSTPSIPYKTYGQGVDPEEEEYVRRLLLKQDISSSSRFVGKKQPNFTFSKSEKQLSYLPKTLKKPTQSQEQQIVPKQQPEPNQQSKATKRKIIWQQKIKQATERRLQVIQTLDPSFVPPLELIELIKKKGERPSPGPGDYHTSSQINAPFELYENPRGVSFTSVKRFEPTKVQALGPGYYEPKTVTESNKKYSFSKNTKNQKPKDDCVNYRFYIDPETSSSLRLSQRGQSCPFGSNSTRFSIHEKPSQQITYAQELRKRASEKVDRIIQHKLKLNKKNQSAQKDEGLLGISTMASMID